PVAESAEGLGHAGAVPLSAELEEVVTTDQGHVVEHLETIIVGVYRNEEGHPHPVALERRVGGHEPDIGVGEGTTRGGIDRTVIRAGPILPGPLEPELVREGRGEGRAQTTVDRMGEIALERVGAATPEVH